MRMFDVWTSIGKWCTHITRSLEYSFFHLKRLKAPEIEKRLLQEGLVATRQGIYNFIKWYEATGTIGWLPGSGRKSKVTDEIRIVEDQMKADDETSAFQLHQLLMSKGLFEQFFDVDKRLDGPSGSVYCQLIRACNDGVISPLLRRKSRRNMKKTHTKIRP